MQASPNPFNPSTTIRFTLPKAVDADLRIYSASGELVRDLLFDVELPVGEHRVTWDGKDGNGRAVSAGVYFMRLEAGGVPVVARMVLLK